MKIHQLAVVTALLSVLLSSCGGSKLADTEQVKSYVLMTSVSDDTVISYIDEYCGKLDAGKVKNVYVPDVKIPYSTEDDMIDKNPWVEKTRFILIPNWWYGRRAYWTLSEEDTESHYGKLWEDNGGSCPYWAEDNTWKYAAEHKDDDSVVGISVIHAWVRFIQKKSDKIVKIYDSYYSKNDSTKSADAYYIIYTIDKNYYVLVRLTEEKKSTRFEIETLARGEQLIEIERKLKLYL